MNVLQKQATKVINQYVEEFDGNWKGIRRRVLQDIDVLFQNGGVGSKALALVLDETYRELAPIEAFKGKTDESK